MHGRRQIRSQNLEERVVFQSSEMLMSSKNTCIGTRIPVNRPIFGIRALQEGIGGFGRMLFDGSEDKPQE